MILLIALEMGAFSGIELVNSQEKSEKEEAMVSFTETGKGFFAGAEEGELEKEAQNTSWWSRVFGGGE